MKLNEILKVIYHEDLDQPVKLCIVDASDYFTRYAKCFVDALEFVTEYKDCKASGVHVEQGLKEPVICISIENFDR